jgi:hypothetical protein
MRYLDENATKVLLKLIQDTQQGNLIWLPGRPILNSPLQPSVLDTGYSGYSGFEPAESFYAQDIGYWLILSRTVSSISSDSFANAGTMSLPWGKGIGPRQSYETSVFELKLVKMASGLTEYTFPKDQLLVDLFTAVVAKNQGVEGYFKKKLSGM